MTLMRVPKERGSATRLEIRLGDGTANLYLAYAAALAAGLDGIRRELEPPSPLEGMIYDLPDEQLGRPLPTTFARGARRSSRPTRCWSRRMGQELVDTFETIKVSELERFRAWVTDWEFAEYSKLL